MKDFPHLTEAAIQHTFSQLQTELALTVLSHFRESLDTPALPNIIQSFLDNAQQRYEFKFHDDYLQQPDTFKLQIELLLDALIDARTWARFEHLGAINGFLYEPS